MFRQILFPLMLFLGAACVSSGPALFHVVELAFGDSHPGCKKAFLVDATAQTQDEARAEVKTLVVKGGANAVVFVGALATFSDDGRDLLSYTERAIAYQCEEVETLSEEEK